MKLSAKMLEMLRLCAKGPNGRISLPYRKGATNTAQALKDRGLIHFQRPDRWSAWIALTEEGRKVLSDTSY